MNAVDEWAESRQAASGYTESQSGAMSDPARLVMSSSISRQTVVRVLAAGFALVILLVAAAAYVSLRRSRAIQQTAAGMVQQHLVTARLIDTLDQDQNSATRILLLLSRLARTDAARAETIASDLDQLETRLKEVVSTGRLALPATAWDELSSASQAFLSHARLLQQQKRISDTELAALGAMEERLATAASQIVREGSQQSLSLEQSIRDQSEELELESMWLLGAGLLMAFLVALTTIGVTHQAFRRLAWQSAELNRVSWHMLQGQEAAARRFSHEMHDELGQSLAGLRAMLMGMRREEIENRRAECVRLLDDAIGNVRELSQLLRPVILDDFGLDAGLRWLGERFGERTRIEVRYDSDFSGRLQDEMETHLFRITQEALTNVARHSGATVVEIHLLAQPDRVRLILDDNGRGLPKRDAGASPSLGMVGMRARAEQAGGELKVGRAPLGGVRIEVWVPRREPVEDGEEKDAYLVGR